MGMGPFVFVPFSRQRYVSTIGCLSSTSYRRVDERYQSKHSMYHVAAILVHRDMGNSFEFKDRFHRRERRRKTRPGRFSFPIEFERRDRLRDLRRSLNSS